MSGVGCTRCCFMSVGRRLWLKPWRGSQQVVELEWANFPHVWL